jgi:hypothetical protein
MKNSVAHRQTVFVSPVDKSATHAILSHVYVKNHSKGATMTQNSINGLSGKRRAGRPSAEPGNDPDDGNLRYPESLLEIWDIWHDPVIWAKSPKEKPEGQSPGNLVVADYLLKRLTRLKKTMAGILCRDGIFDVIDVEEQVWLLFWTPPKAASNGAAEEDAPEEKWTCPATRERLEQYTCQSYLVQDLRKRLNSKRNPSGRDFDLKLRDALRVLIDRGKVELKRGAKKDGPESSPQKGLRFYPWSELKHAEAPDYPGLESDYEQGKDEIPTYRPRRNNEVSIISPKDAEDLEERILRLFNGWITFQELREKAWNHVQPTGKVVSSETVDISECADETNDIPGFVDAEAFEKNDAQQLLVRSDEIWDRICEETDDEFFCLSILPREYGDALGIPKDCIPRKTNDSARESQTDKVREVIKKETFIRIRREEKEKDPNITMEKVAGIVLRILELLEHRCKGLGYDPAAGGQMDGKERTGKNNRTTD